MLNTKSVSYLSTRILQRGKFYYEFTHKSGSQLHLVGYKCSDSSYIAFYASGHPSALVYFDGTISCYNWKRYDNLNFSDIGSEHTVGLGIDIEARQFLIRCNHEVRILEMNMTTKIDYWRAL